MAQPTVSHHPKSHSALSAHVRSQASDTASGYFRDDCRLCHSRELVTFLDLGMQPHSDGFLPAEMLTAKEMFYPLAVNVCSTCGQVQINYIVKPSLLYGSDYLYDSTITATGRDHFLSMAKDIVETFQIPKESLAVDIGSNVGLLLSGFREQGMRVQGVDPTPKMTAIAIAKGIDTIVECFSPDVAKRIVTTKGRAHVITGTNVVAHIDDLDAFMEGVDTLLDDRGILVIEAPYLADMVEHIEYDTIYHQHLSYFAITPLQRFFQRFGMEIFNVRRTSIHGGSIRLFVARAGAYPLQSSVGDLVTKEEKDRLLTSKRMMSFADDVAKHRQSLVRLLVDLRDAGKTIAGIGAPAKGSTLLNFCGINSSILTCTTEKNILKVGRFVPGVRIPILSDAHLLALQPDYALVLPWNFAPEIMRNLSTFKERGGKFIVPIPTPTIV